MKGLDRLKRLKRRFTRPAVLKKLVSEGTAGPRLRVKTGCDEDPKVFRVNCKIDPAEAPPQLDSIWDANYAGLVLPGQTVLIKINLNTGNPYPASTSPEMLCSLVGLLHRTGVSDIIIGDCSSIRALPTRREASKTGIGDAAFGKARLLWFDQGSWVTVPVRGRYLKQVTVPRIALEVDRIIHLANLKTHVKARFSCGLKLGVGYMHPLERYALHRDHLQEKVTEINLAIEPDLTIIDARSAFVTGGPDEGRVEEAGVLIMGTNQLAADLEAYKVLYALKKKAGCLDGFAADPFTLVQLSHARDIGIGGTPWQGYRSIIE